MSTLTKEFNAKHGVLAGTSKENYLEFLGSSTNNPVTISAKGTDADISIFLYPKGNGIVNLPVNTTASVAVSDNISTDNTYYPTFSTQSSGIVQSLSVSSSKLTYNPNLGKLTTQVVVINGNIASTNTTSGTLIVNGGVGISGSLNATTKSFVIPHPTKKGKTLRYGSLESPYHGIRLTGRDKLINGKCIIKLPSYIKKLVHEDGVNIQLTNIKHGKVLWIDEINVSKNQFTICADTTTLIPGNEYEFFWDFTAERCDVERLEVES